MKGRRRRVLVVCVAVSAVVAVSVAAVLLVHPPASASNCSAPPPSYLSGAASQQLVACHATESLAANSFVSVSMPRFSDTESVVGQYTVSQAGTLSVEAFLLNQSQLSAFSSNPHPTVPPPASSWQSGLVPVSDLSVHVPPSPYQYSIVLVNLGNASASVEWTESLVLWYVSTGY